VKGGKFRLVCEESRGRGIKRGRETGTTSRRRRQSIYTVATFDGRADIDVDVVVVDDDDDDDEDDAQWRDVYRGKRKKKQGKERELARRCDATLNVIRTLASSRSIDDRTKLLNFFEKKLLS